MSQMTIPPQRAKAARRKRRPRPVRASSMEGLKGREGHLSASELGKGGK